MKRKCSMIIAPNQFLSGWLNISIIHSMNFRIYIFFCFQFEMRKIIMKNARNDLMSSNVLFNVVASVKSYLFLASHLCASKHILGLFIFIRCCGDNAADWNLNGVRFLQIWKLRAPIIDCAFYFVEFFSSFMGIWYEIICRSFEFASTFRFQLVWQIFWGLCKIFGSRQIFFF